jgi:hypothetical protein
MSELKIQQAGSRLVTAFGLGRWTTQWQGVAANPAGDQFVQFDAAGSIPGYTIAKAKWAVERLAGRRPNTLVMSVDVHKVLMRHDLVISQLKYSAVAYISEQILADYFEVERYIVTEAHRGAALLVFARPHWSFAPPADFGAYLFDAVAAHA